jgi:hypothetical protein
MRQLLALGVAGLFAWSAAIASDSPAPFLQQGKNKGPLGKQKGGGGKGGEGEKQSKKDDESPSPPAPGRELESWGVIKEVKGTPFFTFDYTRVEGKKATRQSAFVKVADEAEVFTDKQVKPTDLKEGESIWLLGKAVENEVPSQTGITGIDRQFQNVLAIAYGEGLRVNTGYKDTRDPKARWFAVTVQKTGPSISVKYSGEVYKVVMGKSASIMHREKEGDAKALKSGAQVEISGDKSEEKPETKNAGDAKKSSFVAKKVAILDRRLTGSLYPMMIE